jgi:hypothetical protein
MFEPRGCQYFSLILSIYNLKHTRHQEHVQHFPGYLPINGRLFSVDPALSHPVLLALVFVAGYMPRFFSFLMPYFFLIFT